jgi:WhiB family redox-sensing transcriptional regulator
MTALHAHTNYPVPVPPGDDVDLEAAADAFLEAFPEEDSGTEFEDLTSDNDGTIIPLYPDIQDADPDYEDEDPVTEVAALTAEGSRLAKVYGTAVWEEIDKELPVWSSDLGPESDWQQHALCATVDPELWFPEKGGAGRVAKEMCMKCPVRRACLEYALDTNERFGIWGGFSERERRVIARSRAVNLARGTEQKDTQTGS